MICDAMQQTIQPKSGTAQACVTSRVWATCKRTLDRMPSRARDLLAANVNALMAARPGLGSNQAVTKAGGPTNGSIDRIRRATHACRIDELDKLAAVFGVEPRSLLEVDADNGPPLSREARRLARDYDAISDPALQGAVRAMLELVLHGAAPRSLAPPAAGAVEEGKAPSATRPPAAPRKQRDPGP